MGRAFEFRKARKMKRWSAMSKAFTRIGKDIVMAVKEGGPDPDSNARLRAVIQNAKSVNMPKDNVERAIKKASDKTQGDYKEVIFEGYAPHGIAVLVETATDNNNRSVANIRSYFNKCNGSLSTNGSHDYTFERKAYFKIDVEALAKLPSLNDLRGKLVGLLQAPASKILRLSVEPASQVLRTISQKSKQ